MNTRNETQDAAERLALTSLAASIRANWALALYSLAMFAALAGPLAVYVKGLLAREHYEFAVLVPIGAVALLFRYRGLSGKRPFGKIGPFLCFSFAALLSLCISYFLISPWFASISCVLTLASVAYGLGGPGLLRNCLPALIFLCTAVRLPANLDVLLVAALQRVAARWASGFLDLAGVLHVLDGVIIKLPERQLFVEEACSGIHSLFSALTCVLFATLWLRRRAVHVLLMLAATAAWVLVVNAARVLSGAILAGTWAEPLTRDTLHMAFGLLCFAAIMLLALCTDRLLLSLIPDSPIRRKRAEANRDRQRAGSVAEAHADSGQHETDTASQGKVVLGKDDRFDDVAKHWGVPADACPEVGRDRLTQQAASAGADFSTSGDRSRSPIIVASIIFCVAATLLLALQLESRGGIFFHSGESELSYDIGTNQLSESTLPLDLAGWKRTGFQRTYRGENMVLAADNCVWLYRRGGARASFAVSCPFSEWHDVSLCYRQRGWEVRCQQVRPMQLNDGPISRARYLVLELAKPTLGEYGIAFCCMYSPSAGFADPISTGPVGMQLRRLRSAFGRFRLPIGMDASKAHNARYYQLHLLVLSHMPVRLNEREGPRAELDAARTLFESACRTLCRRLSSHAGND